MEPASPRPEIDPAGAHLEIDPASPRLEHDPAGARLEIDPAALGRLIVDACRALGFHRAGIAPVEPAARHDLYERWVAAGYAGEMTYLAGEGARARRDVRALFAGAKTVVVVALSYGAPDAAPAVGLRGQLARYARGEDYHIILKRKLNALAARLSAALGAPIASLACVDTAHLLERDLAERAGLGFVGKNTLLIAPGLGSYVMLGELLLEVSATPTASEPVRKRCGSCRACLDKCPTGAFVDDFVLDARRCISYLTIELCGPIPRDLRPLMGTMIFGCDICQEVCPFNASVAAGQAAPPAPEFAPRSADRGTPELLAILSLGAAQFRRFVKRTSLRRVSRARLLRNVCVALGNAGDAAAIPPLREAMDDPHPLIRGHAAWALGRLGDRAFLAARVESDAAVREEIAAALV